MEDIIIFLFLKLVKKSVQGINFQKFVISGYYFAESKLQGLFCITSKHEGIFLQLSLLINWSLKFFIQKKMKKLLGNCITVVWNCS